MKEKSEPEKFKNFLLPSHDEKYKCTSVVSVRNTFGCTFHVCVEFFSESEVKGRADDWINVVRRGILQNNSRIKCRPEYQFLKSTFEVLFPSLAHKVMNAKSVEALPKGHEILQALDPTAVSLMKQKFHIFAGQGTDFHQDQIFLMKTMEEELGIGMEDRSRNELVKCYIIKKVTNYIPSLLLATGCSITDSPGTGDKGLLQKFLVQEALEKHDVIVAVCEKSLQFCESTFNALFQNVTSSSFISRLLQDPSGKNLVIMHCYEQKALREYQRMLSENQADRAAFMNTKQKTIEQSLHCAKEGVQGVKDLSESLRQFPDRTRSLDGCITAMTTFPIMYFSLILNSKYAEELEAIGIFDAVLRSTDGHKFMVLPEYLESACWRQQMQDLATFLKSKGGIIHQDEQTHMISNQARDNVKKFIEFCNVPTGKIHATLVKFYKEALENLGSKHNTHTMHAWESLKVGDIIKGVFLESNGKQNPWAVRISSMDNVENIWEVAYIGDDLFPWLDESGNECKHRVRFTASHDGDKRQGNLSRDVETISDVSEGQTIALQLHAWTIDKAICQFEDFHGRRGLVTAILERFFQIFQSDVDKATPYIVSELEKDFDEIRRLENERFQTQTDDVFAQICQGKSSHLNIVDKIFQVIDQQLYASFCASNSTREQQVQQIECLKGTFDFKKMIEPLRKELSRWQVFIADRIRDIILTYTCHGSYEGDERARIKDTKEISRLFTEYMEVGSRFLQERVDQVFTLAAANKVSAIPDYDFFTEHIRLKLEEEVIELLKQHIGESAEEKIEYLLRHVRSMLSKVLISVQKLLQATFAQNLAQLRHDLIPSREYSLESFTHEFIFQFIQKLNNTANRPTEAREGFLADFSQICAEVDEMFESLPNECDVGMNMHHHMKYSKAVRDIKSIIDRELLKSLKLKYLHFSSCEYVQSVLCLKHTFAEMGQCLSQHISLEGGQDREVSATFFSQLGYKMCIDEDNPQQNTLWRALATQFRVFEGFKAPDVNVLKDQLRAAVADQILYTFKTDPCKTNSKAVLGTSCEEFALKLLNNEHELLVSDIEICLHFFLLCFCKAKATNVQLKGINIWFHGCKVPKIQLVSPCSLERLRDQFKLCIEERDNLSVIHDFGSHRPAMDAINIAVFAESENTTSEEKTCLRFAGLERSRPVEPVGSNWHKRKKPDEDARMETAQRSATKQPKRVEEAASFELIAASATSKNDSQRICQQQEEPDQTEYLSQSVVLQEADNASAQTSVEGQPSTEKKGGRSCPPPSLKEVQEISPVASSQVPAALDRFEQKIISKIHNAKTRLLVFEFDAFYRLFVFQKSSRPNCFINLLRAWKNEDETIIVIISHVVDAKLMRYAETKSKETARMFSDFDFRDKVTNCVQLRDALNNIFKDYGEFNPENNVHFILQDREHQIKCCGKSPWNMLSSVLLCASSVKEIMACRSFEMEVVVVDEAGAQGTINHSLHDIRGKFRLVSFVDLIRKFERSKHQKKSAAYNIVKPDSISAAESVEALSPYRPRIKVMGGAALVDARGNALGIGKSIAAADGPGSASVNVGPGGTSLVQARGRGGATIQLGQGGRGAA